MSIDHEKLFLSPKDEQTTACSEWQELLPREAGSQRQGPGINLDRTVRNLRTYATEVRLIPYFGGKQLKFRRFN